MKPQSFGWRDYWRMLTSGRPWLPWKYFREAHAYDLRRGTDTHFRLRKEDYGAEPPSFDLSNPYAASWTSEVDWAFHATRDLLGTDFDRFTFLDAGCGKGKVILRWTELCRAAHSTQPIAGFDYYEPLTVIARRNHQKLFGEPGRLTTDNADTIDFTPYGDRIICYMYNSFQAPLMRRYLERLLTRDVVLVYNNPVEDATLRDLGFVVLRTKQGNCPAAHTVIYANRRTIAN